MPIVAPVGVAAMISEPKQMTTEGDDSRLPWRSALAEQPAASGRIRKARE